MEAFCHGSPLVMKPGSITLKNRQEVSGMASSKFSEVVVKATPLAWKVMAAVFLGAEGVILEDIILHGKLVTQTCTFRHLKPSRSISGEFKLKSSIISTHDHTPKFKTTGSNHKTWMDCSSQPMSLEPTKVPSIGKGLKWCCIGDVKKWLQVQN
jgi:hypothetical protein